MTLTPMTAGTAQDFTMASGSMMRMDIGNGAIGIQTIRQVTATITTTTQFPMPIKVEMVMEMVMERALARVMATAAAIQAEVIQEAADDGDYSTSISYIAVALCSNRGRYVRASHESL